MSIKINEYSNIIVHIRINETLLFIIGSTIERNKRNDE